MANMYRGNGQLPDFFENPANIGRALAGAFLAFILIIGGMTSYYTIDVSEEGVVTRFGKYMKTTPPGLHFKLPFGAVAAQGHTIGRDRDQPQPGMDFFADQD